MKSIKKLWRKYNGRTAFLFGTGPSIEKFKNPRKDNEVWFGINYAYKKIDQLDFLFIQDWETYLDIKTEHPDNLIIPSQPGLVRRLQTERIPVNDPYAYGYILQDPMKNHRDDLPNKDLSLDEDVKIFSYTATSQCALHILAYMGFKDIYLIGFDNKPYANGKMHFETTNKEYSEQGAGVLARIEEGNNFIIKNLTKIHGNIIINLSHEL